MRLLLSIALFFTAHFAAASFEEGDACGVTSRDFLNYDFASNYTVAGEGCTLGNETGCYCAPDFSDNAALSDWKWQCNDTVKFGPVEGKVCPATVPVPKKNGISDSSFEESMLGVPVYCNTTIHPTGRGGDEVCDYSECETGGSFSAICACVDLDDRGIGGGVQWFCMHSKCSCTDEEEAEPFVAPAPSAAAPVKTSAAVAASVFAAATMMVLVTTMIF